jgi:hypothetical protein
MPDGGAELTFDTFAARVGDSFRVDAGDGVTLELRLAAADSLGASPGEGFRAPFALTFLGPTSPILPQRIYELKHDSLGSVALFVIPRQPDTAGGRYEVIFN